MTICFNMDTLCNSCRSIFSWCCGFWLHHFKSGRTPVNTGIFHGSGLALKDSTANCCLCAIVWENLTSEQRVMLGSSKDSIGDISARIWWKLQDSPGSKKDFVIGFIIQPTTPIRISGSTEESRGENFIFRLQFFEKNSPGQSIFQGTHKKYGTPRFRTNSRTVDMDTGSESSWKLASDWLRECITNHHSCKPIKASAKIKPSRLIVIKASPLHDNPCLQLAVSEEIPENPKYTTLSHCWGRLAICTLTTKNIGALKNNIPWQELPKTFIDAVVITQRLDIRFIWIDSLCILQDSIEDWGKESNLMHHVFSNAFLNIAATSAPDARAGCFFQRNPLAMQGCEIDVTWRGDESPTTMIAYQEDFPNAHNDYAWIRGFEEEEPLNRRAWVLQERILAPRTLHFTSSQLVWECNECVLCEKFPQQEVSHIYGSGIYAASGLIRTKAKRMFLGDAYESDYRHIWEEIVESYSKLDLTKYTDKLAALAGIAGRLTDIRRLPHNSYVWGLWRDQLDMGLLWYVKEPEKTIRFEIPIAPSWSWASVQGEIIYQRFHTRTIARIVKLVNILGFPTDQNSSSFGNTVKMRMRCYMTTTVFSQGQAQKDLQVWIDEKWIQVSHDNLHFDVWPYEQGTTYFLVPVIHMEMKAKVFPQLLYGLVLKASSDPNTFHRVGHFELPEVSFGSDHSHTAFWKSCFKYGVTTGGETYGDVLKFNGNLEERYEVCDGVVQHEIGII